MTGTISGMSTVWLNGELVDDAGAHVSVYDHGLLYGDGCFEGIRVYGGRIFKLRSHLQRMYASAEAIRLVPAFEIDEIEAAVRDTVVANELVDGYVRLVFTRGRGTLGLNPFHCPTTAAFIIAETITLYPQAMYDEGLSIIVASQRRVPRACLDPQIKSLNYLNNIVAKIEAIDAGALEALMLNCDGEVAECTGDNIFIVKDGAIVTPETDSGILHGITRAFVIEELAPARGWSVEERIVSLEEVLEADEVFLTGTAAEVIGVTSIDGQGIGDGGVGPMTTAMVEEFRRRVGTDAPED